MSVRARKNLYGIVLQKDSPRPCVIGAQMEVRDVRRVIDLNSILNHYRLLQCKLVVHLELREQ